jgi:cyclophilin family peptidyl-prolyl cis-trans isomerase
LNKVPDQKPLTPAEASPIAGSASPVASGDCWAPEQRSGAEAFQWSSPPAMVVDPAKQYTATVVTNYGAFTIRLFAEDAPITVNNFVCLARAGFYDNTTFHRVVQGFVIQGGDPTGTGTGGPGYTFDDEVFSHDYLKGTVAMANAGPNTNGSQFFVTLVDLQGQLPKNYTIFGIVESGQDVVDKIGNVATKQSGQGENSQPVDPVTVETVTINET